MAKFVGKTVSSIVQRLHLLYLPLPHSTNRQDPTCVAPPKVAGTSAVAFRMLLLPTVLPKKTCQLTWSVGQSVPRKTRLEKIKNLWSLPNFALQTFSLEVCLQIQRESERRQLSTVHLTAMVGTLNPDESELSKFGLNVTACMIFKNKTIFVFLGLFFFKFNLNLLWLSRHFNF